MSDRKNETMIRIGARVQSRGGAWYEITGFDLENISMLGELTGRISDYRWRFFAEMLARGDWRVER